ncbi:MAG: YdeI/OmpD-associated family protein [Armatimonadetes bacterium]|nr:YdeI/OmpD-associated family protein [Armatimonadota bacterium]
MASPQDILARYERVEITSRAEWRAWLQEHHTQTESIWLVRYKQAVREKSVSYDEIVEEALCFGWIDSRPARLDDERTMLLISPRKPKSVWSALNKSRLPALIESGLMAEPGFASIREAQANGSWDALAEVDDKNPPSDLMDGFSDQPAALTQFQSFPPSAQRGIIQWIVLAKTLETRERRISETVRLAGLGLKANSPESRGK